MFRINSMRSSSLEASQAGATPVRRSTRISSRSTSQVPPQPAASSTSQGPRGRASGTVGANAGRTGNLARITTETSYAYGSASARQGTSRGAAPDLPGPIPGAGDDDFARRFARQQAEENRVNTQIQQKTTVGNPVTQVNIPSGDDGNEPAPTPGPSIAEGQSRPPTKPAGPPATEQQPRSPTRPARQPTPERNPGPGEDQSDVVQTTDTEVRKSFEDMHEHGLADEAGGNDTGKKDKDNQAGGDDPDRQSLPPVPFWRVCYRYVKVGYRQLPALLVNAVYSIFHLLKHAVHSIFASLNNAGHSIFDFGYDLGRTLKVVGQAIAFYLLILGIFAFCVDMFKNQYGPYLCFKHRATQLTNSWHRFTNQPDVTQPYVFDPASSYPWDTVGPGGVAPPVMTPLKQAVNELNGLLPENIVLVKGEDNEWKVSDRFWDALHRKLTDEGFQVDNEDRAAAFTAWLDENRMMLSDMLSAKTDIAVKRYLNKHYAITGKTNFIHEVETRFQALADKLAEDIKRNSGATLTQEMVNEATSKWLTTHYSSTPKESLARFVQWEQTQLALKSVNFFSLGFGPVINPVLTSATQAKTANMFGSIYRHVMLMPAQYALMALSGWEEPTDCWCAAKTEKGNAQIGITMRYPTYPTKITIEHMPEAATLDIKSAPKVVEVWGYFPDEEDYARAWDHIHASHDPRLNCDTAPAEGYLCLGKVIYNIHSFTHIQTLNLGLPTVNLDLPVDTVVVRVTENYGRDYTCLYRLRLHGEMLEEPDADEEELQEE